MTVTVTCKTKDCHFEDQPRQVGLQHLGQDVYLTGTFICGRCGAVLVETKE